MTIHTFQVPAQGSLKHIDLITDDYGKAKDRIRLQTLHFLLKLAKRSGEDFVRLADSGATLRMLLSFLDSLPREWTPTARVIKKALFERVC